MHPTKERRLYELRINLTKLHGKELKEFIELGQEAIKERTTVGYEQIGRINQGIKGNCTSSC